MNAYHALIMSSTRKLFVMTKLSVVIWKHSICVKSIISYCSWVMQTIILS